MNDINVRIDDVIKINVDDGDTLLVRMPPWPEPMPQHIVNKQMQLIRDAFTNTFREQDVKILVVPHLLQVEVIKSSEFSKK